MEDEHDYQEEVEIPSETVASNPRKRKQMDTRSDVWTHYNKIKDENGNLIKGQCKYCSKELGANTSRNDWMRSTAKAINVEEDPEEMRQLDEALEKMNVDASSTSASATGTSEPQRGGEEKVALILSSVDGIDEQSLAASEPSTRIFIDVKRLNQVGLQVHKEWLGNSLMRILHVAAFAVSGYASTDGRHYKPFNPMLGETYEADYPEKGLRFFSEKETPPNFTWYNLTPFAITLNKLTPGVQEKLPPTDSRLRPDQRHPENGEYDKANEEKQRLETRQRMEQDCRSGEWTLSSGQHQQERGLSRQFR
ncbi:hypothetical protein POM88_041504 [Heracleum sosnowskyi]|uniref:BED-type domain-containing protein n=1 Tax=Heracleum sosnowskyi TaxID=360622 RepID=A0AAD8MBF0_9APIA|nr:hypothetical protein POM88_041504 [Heracleum sosnowskyi]